MRGCRRMHSGRRCLAAGWIAIHNLAGLLPDALCGAFCEQHLPDEERMTSLVRTSIHGLEVLKVRVDGFRIQGGHGTTQSLMVCLEAGTVHKERDCAGQGKMQCMVLQTICSE